MSARFSEELPEGWVGAALPEVAVLNPTKPKATDHADDLAVTFVPMPAVDAVTGTILSPVSRKFADVRKGFTAFRDEDVILAKITPCMENGKAAIARNLLNGLGFGSTEFHVLRSNGAVLPDYLFYFIRQEAFRRMAEAEMTGSVGQKRVPAEFLIGVTLPVPPLAEQRRIVAAVERLLERISSARERLERVPNTMKRFRQAVLAAACSGRLTADWREENANAEAASSIVLRLSEESVRHPRRGTRKGQPTTAPSKEGFSPAAEEFIERVDELPASWCWAEFGQLVVNHDSLRVPVKQSDRDNRHGEFPYYGAFGIIDHIDSFIFNGDYMLVAEDGKNLESRLRPIAFLAAGRFWVNNHAHVLQPRTGVTLGYLRNYFNSSLLNLGPFLTGIDQVKLNREAMDRIPVPLPPLAEQQEIVRRVSDLFALADVVEQKATSALHRVESLTQAVLAKAFRGELVPTEAELGRSENRSYEPASELLARLKSSVNGVTKQARGRKSSKRASASDEKLLEFMEG